MTIAQIVWDNEKHFGLTDEDIHGKVSVAFFTLKFGQRG